MEPTRNTNYGRRGRGRGRGGGRGNTQDYPNQSAGRGGRHVAHHQSPMPTPQEHRAPIGGSQPPIQPAWRPRMQPQQVVGTACGRGVAWTGRPWGPSAPTPPLAAQPHPQSQMPSRASDALGIQNLQISDDKSKTASPEGKESRLEPIRRPDGGGKLCVKSIKLRANFFPVKFDGTRTILHYDVDVKFCSDDKRAAQRKMRKSDLCLIRDTLFSVYPELKHIVTAYDGSKSIFSPIPLPSGDFIVKIPEGEDTRSGSYQVTIKFANELILSKLKDYIRGNLSYIPRDVLQGMDLVMKENLSRERVCVGRSFYSFAEGDDLPRGLKAYRGLNQSLRPTSQGTALCVDYSILAFREPMPVISFLTEYIKDFRVNDINRRRREVTDALKGLLVGVTHRRTKQKYTIAGLTRENTCDIYFDLIDREGNTPPQNISLVKYFKDKWEVEIEHKNIPCLELGKTNKVPLEFCRLIEGQKCPKELLERLDRERSNREVGVGVLLKKISLAKPSVRENIINRMVQAEDGPCGGGIAKEFGIHVDPNMTRVVGRVIDAPRLKLQGSTMNVDKEKCQWNLVGGKHLMDAKPIECWGMLEFVDDTRHYDKWHSEEFVNKLMARGKSLGIRMEWPLSHCVVPMGDFLSEEKLGRHIRDVIQKSGKKFLQLIVCAMTRKHAGYKILKWVAETRIGVVTQCYLSHTAAKPMGQDQYLANLLLKINAKLGGSNFEIDGKLLPHLNSGEHVMFIGADVNHPAPMNKSCPSIAAVVGTLNWPAANRYAARVVPQAHRKETIVNFGSMCMDLINTYKQFNKVWPSRIVLFRDGVSDGQFEMALEEELHDLRRAFSDNDYKPMVTLIVAQKRHHTRLFLEDQRDGGRSGNVPPGTVVDTTIVHPFGFDFYLCSHYGILGTSKPTHYYVLWDDSSFTSDQLQKLIYDMCFTFARCTKPVSLVPPVYYADLVAYRGRLFQEAVMERQPPGRHSTHPSTFASSSSSSLSSSAGASFDESLYKLHPDMENNMFFI